MTKPTLEQRRWHRTIRSRIHRFIRYLPNDEKRELLVVVDRTHTKRPGARSHHQQWGYHSADVIAYMAKKGLL